MKTTITVVSLGPGDPDLLNMKTIRAMKEASQLVLRTSRHPVASWLQSLNIGFISLDNLYEESEDFDLLNRNAANLLFRLTAQSDIVYAVPDALTDQTVKEIFRNKPDNISVIVIPGLSIHNQHISSALYCLTHSSFMTVPASEMHEHFHYDPGCTLLVTELDNAILAGEVKIILSELIDEEYQIILLRRDMDPVTLPLWQLDRQNDIDHQSSILIPGTYFLERTHFTLDDLNELMDLLRSSSGCPWDRMQTHETLRSFLIEEAWECIDCIDRHDYDHLCEEMGDLLFQIVFHSSIGRSFDEFTINDVISSICLKMIRRHPHVFGSADLKDPESVRIVWEKIKQDETGHHSVISSLDDVSSGLPSLKYASKMLKKCNTLSLCRPISAPVVKDIQNLVSEMISNPDHINDKALGRLLLLCTELCLIQGYDAELLLHQSADRFKSELIKAEKKIINDGKSLEHLTFEELGVYLKYVEDEIE